MTHDELKELLAGHALDVLDTPERSELEAHLASCSTCPAGLAELSEAAGLVGLEADPVAPPAELRARILAAIDAPAARAEVIRPDPGVWRRFAGVGGLAAAAAIVALVMYTWGLANRMQVMHGELVAERERAQFLAAPETQVVLLEGTPDAPRARAKFAYDAKTGRALLFSYGLPAPPAGKAYQLWFIAGGKPLPGRVFVPERNGEGWWAETVPPAGREAAVFAVTLEPSSGVMAPTGPIVLKGVARS